MPEGRFVDESVMPVVADLVQRDVEPGRIERGVAAGERRQFGQGTQGFDQRSGIIRDSATRRRQRREERQAHSQDAGSGLTGGPWKKIPRSPPRARAARQPRGKLPESSSRRSEERRGGEECI